MHPHDFRSDTVTLPTTEMMAAIASARLGDAARGDDPTVTQLEQLACELTGKEDVLFLPSGAMANLAALLAHDCRGREVIVEESSHIHRAEGGGMSTVAGAIARPVQGARGRLSAHDIEAAIGSVSDPARAPARLVCVENTHNAAGGTVTPLETMAAVHAAARRAGIPVHLDGARLFNAAAFLGVPIDILCRHADSVWFALCKGLGAPVGAVLAGDRDWMREARRAARMLGGGMRQAGLIAAPAIVALKDPYAAHRRDHDLARHLATRLQAIDPSLIEAELVQTNIVNCSVGQFAVDPDVITHALRARGVLVVGKGTRIRFVTHSQVDEASVDAAVHGLATTIESLPRRRADDSLHPTPQETS